MYSLRILDTRQFKSVIEMTDVIASVEEAYKLYSSGQAGLFPIILHEFETGKNDTDIKSGHLTGAGIYGLKLLGYNRDNPQRGLPALSGLITLMDIETQQPLGIVDASAVTYMRTGAAGAVGAKTLAREDSRKVVLVGAGVQGRAQLEGLSYALPGLEEVHIVDVMKEAAEKMVSEKQPLYPGITLYAHDFSELETVIQQADVIVTCTTAREFFIKSSWIQPGTHINAIGVDMPGKQELEPSLVASSKVFADSIAQVIVKGECQWASGDNTLPKEDITEIGEVLNGTKEGRASEDEITLFDSTGMALQDLITAKLALDKAKAQNIDTIVRMAD